MRQAQIEYQQKVDNYNLDAVKYDTQIAEATQKEKRYRTFVHLAEKKKKEAKAEEDKLFKMQYFEKNKNKNNVSLAGLTGGTLTGLGLFGWLVS